MKKLLIVAICAAGVMASQAQGLINFSAIQTVRYADGPNAGALVGPEISAQLFAGPAGTTDASALSPIGSPVASVGAGSWVAGQTPVPGIPTGASAAIQMRASGSLSGTTYTGASTIRDSQPLGGGLQPGPNVTVDAFTVSGGPIIPEPSTIALAVLGAGALFLRRRK